MIPFSKNERAEYEHLLTVILSIGDLNLFQAEEENSIF